MLGHYSEALADFDHAITLNSRYAEAYYNRGVAKHILGDEAGAEEDFARATEIDPSLKKDESEDRP